MTDDDIQPSNEDSKGTSNGERDIWYQRMIERSVHEAERQRVNRTREDMQKGFLLAGIMLLILIFGWKWLGNYYITLRYVDQPLCGARTAVIILLAFSLVMGISNLQNS